MDRREDRKPGRSPIYHIRLRGALDESWSDWFEGMAVIPQPGDETLLAGPLADQAALHGILARVRDLNLGLIAVKRIEAEGRRDGFDCDKQSL